MWWWWWWGEGDNLFFRMSEIIGVKSNPSLAEARGKGWKWSRQTLPGQRSKKRNDGVLPEIISFTFLAHYQLFALRNWKHRNNTSEIAITVTLCVHFPSCTQTEKDVNNRKWTLETLSVHSGSNVNTRKPHEKQHIAESEKWVTLFGLFIYQDVMQQPAVRVVTFFYF